MSKYGRVGTSKVSVCCTDAAQVRTASAMLYHPCTRQRLINALCKAANICGAPLSTTTKVSYDPAWQGGTQYGNQTTIEEFEGSSTTPYRVTQHRYAIRDDVQRLSGGSRLAGAHLGRPGPPPGAQRVLL